MSDLLSALGSVATWIFTQLGNCATFFTTTPLFQFFIGVVAVALIISLAVYIIEKLKD